MSPPVVLAVAGSDSSGGAGLQADLAAIRETGCLAASAVTAVTAQHSDGSVEWEPVSAPLVRAQLRAGLSGLRAAAVKTGMLGTAEIVEVVAAELRAAGRPLVCDPVAATSSGCALISPDGLRTLMDELLPLATLVTPNAIEAGLLTASDVTTPDEAEAAGRALVERGAEAVLVKGGHFEIERGTDVLVTRRGVQRFSGDLIEAPNVRGTGCWLSAVIACVLAAAGTLEEAIESGREAVRARLSAARTREAARR